MDFSDFEEKRTGGELIFTGRIIRVERDEIVLPNGKPGIREVVRHPGAVCIVPLTADGCVICERQYRYPHAKVMLEIPAGKLEPGENDHAAAALRELREETGLRCGRLTPLGDYISSPAILDEVIHMYLAEELTEGNDDPDEDEFIEVVRLPLDELCRMIADGEITDGKTQTAILKTAYILSKR